VRDHKHDISSQSKAIQPLTLTPTTMQQSLLPRFPRPSHLTVCSSFAGSFHIASSRIFFFFFFLFFFFAPVWIILIWFGVLFIRVAVAEVTHAKLSYAVLCAGWLFPL